MDSTNTGRNDEKLVLPDMTEIVPITPSDVVPIDVQKAMSSYTEEERKEILALADCIDVKETEKVMSYGSIPLRQTFDQAGAFLKEERGSAADQEVIKQVIALSKKASASYEDFNLVLKEPNLFQRFILSFYSAGKKKQTEKIQNSAVTNYKLLVELRESCGSWLDMLKKAYGDIGYSVQSDMDTIALLEKYIIAGKIAEKRIADEAQEIQKQYQETGLQKYGFDYQLVKEGLDLFQITMANLEKSRIMYYLSIGQLSLIRSSNRDVQISIHTQMDNSLALMSQQIRNAVLDAKTREVSEAQKAISRLNDELIVDVSKRAKITAEDARKLLYAGFYNVEAAKEAVQTVINGCESIKKTAEEMLPKMKADTSQLNDLITQLEPYVKKLDTQLSTENSAPTQIGNGQLTF